MVVDNDRNDGSAASKTSGVKDSNDERSRMQQQVQEQFREIELANSKIQALCSKLQRLCKNLGKIRRPTKPPLNPLDTNNDHQQQQRYVVGCERIYLSRWTSHLEQTRCDWEAALRFVQECIALRNNDPSVTSVSLYHNTTTLTPPSPYRMVLGDCLKSNTTITDLSLHMGTSLTEPEDGDDAITEVGCMKDLLQYLGSSTTLQRVSLVCGGDDDDHPTTTPNANTTLVADTCLAAISRNRNILHLELDFPPTMGLTNLLSTTSIESLDLQSTDGSSYTEFDRRSLGMAFANNRSVTSLILRADELDRNDDSNLIDTILCGGDSEAEFNNRSLQNLTLQYDHGGDPPDLQCVSYFLQHTTTLQELVIFSCVFVSDNMEQLLEGLRQHYVAPKHRSTLTKLTLTDCIYDDDAESLLLRFMQSTELYKNRTADSAMLEEFHIDFHQHVERDDYVDDDDDYEMPEATFSDLPFGIAMASMILPLIAPTNNRGTSTTEIQPTVGSQLRVFELQPFFAMAGFCDHLLSNVTLMQVPDLRLGQVRKKEWRQLAKLIPEWKTLRELHLLVENDVTQKDILSVIRETDHLHVLSVMDENGNQFFNDSELQRIDALFQRNKALGGLLSRKRHWKLECNGSKRNIKRRKTMPSFMLDDNKNDDDDVAMFPMLLRATNQVHSTRVSNILSALLVFEIDCVGT